MKPRPANIYRLHLLAIGATSYVLIATLAGFYRVWRTGSLVRYDFGNLLLSVGGVLTFLGLLVFFSSALWRHQIRRSLPPDDQNLPVRDAGSDYLLTFAMSSLLVTVTGLLLISNMVSSGERIPIPGAYPHIGSARVALASLQAEAQRWREDAYLVEITLELAETSPYRMLADYESPSASSETLSLWMQPDGTISRHIYQLATAKWKAIQDADWPIDSEDALRLFAAKEGISFCLMSSAQHENSLQLRRFPLKDSQPVVWTLFLRDCAETQENRHHLNANTGEWIQIELDKP